MTIEVGRCSSCTHTILELGAIGPPRLECSKITDVSMMGGYILPGELAATTDGGCYKSSLVVSPDFGCILWESE